MNKLLAILLIISPSLTQEMEVDGNLKVTDTLYVTTIQSATIDSLLSLISQLEMRIAQLECQNTGIIPDGYCDCFFHTLDECGVCNGDTTTCQDCAGVPNGDNLEDNCGNCDNDSSNDCVQDCFGEWDGTAEYDACGVCGGGNSSCADCAGVPNGDAEEDECGVCDNDLDNDCINYALSFNGNDDYVFIDDVLPIDDEYTINIMVKRVGTEYESFFWNGTVAGQLSWIEIYTQPNSFQNGALTVAHNRNMSNFDFHYFDTLPIGQWLYLSVVYQDGMVSVYYDGIFMGSVSMPLETNPGISENYFGHTTSNYLNGSLDRISVWNIALTSSEIQTYMASSPVGNENLIGYWNFNEGTGNTLYDYSGNNYNGTINGNPEWVQVSP